MNRIRVAIAICLIISMIPFVQGTNGDDSIYINRVIVLEEVESAWSPSELRTKTVLSQTPLLSVLERLMADGIVIDYQPFWIANMVSVVCKTSALNDLMSAPGVIGIMPNIRIYAHEFNHTNLIQEDDKLKWNLEMIGALDIQNGGNLGNGAIIGVLDSGCDSTHPELEGKVKSYALFDSYGRKTSQSVASDSDGHGTSVCSIIAGETTGVAPSSQLIVGSVIPSGSGSLSQILGGMQWILNPDGDYSTDDYPRVVNMSFGAPGTMSHLESGIKNFVRMGIIPIASSGNDGEGSTSNPGNFEEVISVGSVDFTSEVSRFSGGASVSWENIDEVTVITKPDLVAPGEGIRVATPHRTYDMVDGTSSAAPHVAGLCALLLSENPGMAPEDIRHALIEGAVPLGKDGKDRRYGFGLINAENSFTTIEGRQVRSIDIKWGNHTLWGDIEIETDSRTYAISREQADGFTFLTEPNENITVSSFGFEDASVASNVDTVILSPLPTYELDLTAISSEIGEATSCKLRFPDAPLPTTPGHDGHIKITLPTGTHKARIYSFGHADKSFEISMEDDLTMDVFLETAEIAFIDDRESSFGIPPEPIQGRMRRCLDDTEMPYFIWTTREGRVTGGQLSKFPYVIWNLGGSPDGKITKILSEYMDKGGKLILTSDFYGASYLGESDSTVFLENYFDCLPTSDGGSSVKYWSGDSWETTAIETKGFLRSSELVPTGSKAEPLFYYSGSEKQTVAGLRVSTLMNQGIILGFTIPKMSSDESRSQVLDYCLSAFDDTILWSANVSGDGKKVDGVTTIGDETVQFTDGDLLVAHMPNQSESVTVSSFGFNSEHFNGYPSQLPGKVDLTKANTDHLEIHANTDFYIIFEDVPVDPIHTEANGNIELYIGEYDLTLTSKGFTPQRLTVSVPGKIDTNFVHTPDHVLLPKEYDNLAGTLSTLGLPHTSKANVNAGDIVSSSVFIWNSGNRIGKTDRELTKEIKTALMCDASVIIAGPEVVSEFGDPIEIESRATKTYAVMGRDDFSGMLISIGSAAERYGVNIPVLSGGIHLARFPPGGGAVCRYDNLIACGFEFEGIDLKIVLEEFIRILVSQFGLNQGKLPRPRLISPSSPTNIDPLKITGFAPPSSSTTLIMDGRPFTLMLDPEGFFTQTIDVADGTYELTITSSKDGKTSSTKDLPLVVDRTPPQVIVYSPRGGRTSYHEVEFIASCIGAKTLTVNGVNVKVNANGSVSKNFPTGSGSLNLIATDTAGNRTSMMMNYIPDPDYAGDSTSGNAPFEVAQVCAGGITDESDRVFRPFQPITKAEVAVWLTRTLRLDSKPGACPYPDVQKNSKEEPYIGALFSAGILSGKGNYHPNSNSTMEFLLQMIANSFDLSACPSIPTFPDLTEDSPWYKGVEGCVKAKLINPKDERLFSGGLFKQGSGVKRECVAIVLYWLMKYQSRKRG